MNNDLFAEQYVDGYRIELFQMYNWGVFNNTIYTETFNGKSALLTGNNGTGKTTLVDGLVTLLVPSAYRKYNQSSGTEKSRDRDEESYVLGAYGNKQEEDSAVSKAQYLRNKDTISILNGVFYNDKLKNYVSLLQVRYFKGSEIKRIFGITRSKLTIEEINDFLNGNNSPLDTSGKWKRFITEKYSTIFKDEFKPYSSIYSEIFGFKSDNALKLFSQIVGLKVLDNLNTFIKTAMLDPIDTKSEFEKLQENYKKLVLSDKEIKKTKYQLSLLQEVFDKGEAWKKTRTEQEKNADLLSTLPAWTAKSSIDFLESLKCQKEEDLKREESRKTAKEKIQESIQTEIDGIKITLASLDITREMDKLESQIKLFSEKKENALREYDLYKRNATILELPLPQNEKTFAANSSKLNKLMHTLEAENNAVEDKKFNARKTQEEVNSEIEKNKAELESLGERRTNIPSANLSIRSMICKAIKCEEEELPFAGELIQVKESEKKWEYAIERLLHHFALTLLVPENYYNRVTAFVKDNNINGRIVYFKVEDSVFDSYEIDTDSNTVPGKIELKQNTLFTGWLNNYVNDHFDFLCTDEIKEINANKRVITSSGLIKNEYRNEKDDRNKNTNKILQVLGWDNTEKKKLLSNRIDELLEEQNSINAEIKTIADRERLINNKLNSVRNLEDIISWDTIDYFSCSVRIDEFEQTKRKLEASEKSKEFQEYNSKLKIKKTELDEVTKNILEIYGNCEKLKLTIEETNEELNVNYQAWETYKDTETIEDKLGIFIKEFQIKEKEISSTRALKSIQKNIADRLGKNRDLLEKQLKLQNDELTEKMIALTSPSRDVINQYDDWSVEFADVKPTSDYLGDFEAIYARLKKDDLPKYEAQFHDYLNNTINQDLIDFSEFIDSKQQEIKVAIRDLNASLRRITYQKNPATYLQLIYDNTKDTRIKEFKQKLINAKPDAYELTQHNPDYEARIYHQVKEFLDSLQASESTRAYVLDLRNWFNFAAMEYYEDGDRQKQYYSNSSSLSGGEKAKLTYTILASAITYQFGLNEDKSSSFRFVIVDEVFSRSDAINSQYAMELFKQLDLQVMVVTPMDKVNIVEDYISSIHITESISDKESRLLSMTIDRYQDYKEEREKSNDNAQ